MSDGDGFFEKRGRSFKNNLPIFIFSGIFLLWTICQTGFLGTIIGYLNNPPGLQDSNAKSNLSFITQWWPALGGLLGITLFIILICFLFRNVTLLIIWFVLMIIVNLILLGFGFYFLSVILNSTDYTSTNTTYQTNANTIKNYIIALLAFTGASLLTLIVGLIYYYNFRTSTFAISSFFGGEPSIEDWFKLQEGADCKKSFTDYKETVPIVRGLVGAFGPDGIGTQKVKKALSRWGNYTPEKAEKILTNLGYKKDQTTIVEEEEEQEE